MSSYSVTLPDYKLRCIYKDEYFITCITTLYSLRYTQELYKWPLRTLQQVVIIIEYVLTK